MACSGGSAAADHEPGLGDAAIEKEYEQQHRDREAERWLRKRSENTGRHYGDQREQPGQGQEQAPYALREQADGTEQVVEVVKPKQHSFQ